MNKHHYGRRFVLLISLMTLLCIGVSGTTAFMFDKSAVITNTFVYDPSIFPAVDLPDTGDHSSLLLYGALLTMSLGALAFRRRAEKKD